MLFMAVLITVLIRVLALTQPHGPVEGVRTLSLPAGCNLDYQASIHTVALACPGVDYVRL
jgi:hypothetical protein